MGGWILGRGSEAVSRKEARKDYQLRTSGTLAGPSTLTSQLPHRLCPAYPALDMAAPAGQRTRPGQSSASFRMWDTQLLLQLEGRVNPTAQEVPEGLGGPWEWLSGWGWGWALCAHSLTIAGLEVLRRGGEGRAATLTPASLPLTPSEHATEGRHRTFPMS